jgi:hypothetical protein
MSKLGTAFTTAWKDIKKVATEAASFVTSNSATIQKDVAIGSAILTTAVPSLAPAVTVFDSVEEAAMGELCAVASDVTNATTLEGLFGAAWPTIQALVKTLSTHPAVTAAQAPAAAPATGAA